jgi:hypothetical protein
MRLPAARVAAGKALKPCRSAQASSFKIFIRFERFQIALPPEKFGIILCINRHDPVMPADTKKSETPP